MEHFFFKMKTLNDFTAHLLYTSSNSLAFLLLIFTYHWSIGMLSICGFTVGRRVGRPKWW